MRSESNKGDLIIIGGREDKAGDRTILKKVAEQASVHGGPLVLVTTATSFPTEVAREYRSVFGDLGVSNTEVLDVRCREDAYDEVAVRKLAGASVVFFTGGDQERITTRMGGSPVLQRIVEMHDNEGVTIAGTSAGAAAMSETMLFGFGDEAPQRWRFATVPGLSLLKDVVIDSHFAARGRMGRLLKVVAKSPRTLGLGIDEDTAVVAGQDGILTVIGTGAVYVVDGSESEYANLKGRDRPEAFSLFGMKLHVLSSGDRFDLRRRIPIVPEWAGI